MPAAETLWRALALALFLAATGLMFIPAAGAILHAIEVTR
jgi:hypothetical protein